MSDSIQESRKVNRKVVRAVATGTRATNKYAEMLQEYREVSEQITPLLERKAELEAKIFATMNAANCLHADFENVVADIVQAKGRVSNVIDPEKFRKLAKDDKTFYACINVVSTRAKSFFTEVELKSITTSTPGELGEKKLSIQIN